jgi:DNA repair exonuclease SbcCD nuclease subunit
MLLLGGDLFDQVNPSQMTIYRCLRSLRTHIFGGKDI